MQSILEHHRIPTAQLSLEENDETIQHKEKEINLTLLLRVRSVWPLAKKKKKEDFLIAIIPIA